MAEALHEVAVGREPADAVELVGREPACGLVLFEAEVVALQVAAEAVHGEVEVGIVPFDGLDEVLDGDVRLKLFPQLALEGLLGAFARLYLAAGELPVAFPLALAALGGEEASGVVVDDGGCHL